MYLDWGLANQLMDDAAITAGIVWLIVRQFVWRSTDLKRMVRLPVAILGLGLVSLAVEAWGRYPRVAADWMIVGELVLVAITGTVMGHVTRFRTVEGRLQYRLNTTGLWLWMPFVGIRVGGFLLASMLGANLAGATGLILLSFGVNRLAAILVVRRRAESILAREQPSHPRPSPDDVP